MKDTASHSSIDDYISTFPADVQRILEKIREIIRREAPNAQEALKYGIPTFQIEGKNLVHFAAYAQHIGFYPTPSAILAFKDQLSSYKTAKGSIQFSLDQPIPYDLVKKIVQFRVNEMKKI